MDNRVFEMRFAAKSLVRESKKSEKESKASKLKCKKALEKGNTDGARIYAQNAIRQKNEALNFLRLSARVDAVASKCQQAAKMNMVTKGMNNIVKSMDAIMTTMNLEKISGVMEKFEKQFEDLDLRSEYMENAMTSSQALTTPESEVEALMQQVADEHNLEFESDLDSVVAAKPTAATHKDTANDEDKALEERLRKLQGI